MRAQTILSLSLVLLTLAACNNSSQRTVAPQDVQNSESKITGPTSTYVPISKDQLIAKIGQDKLEVLQTPAGADGVTYIESPFEQNQPVYQLRNNKVEAKQTVPIPNTPEAHIDYWLEQWGNAGHIHKVVQDPPTDHGDSLYELRATAKGMTVLYDQTHGRVLKVFEYAPK